MAKTLLFPDSTVGKFYVTQKRDSQVKAIAGPFASRAEALAALETAKSRAEQQDPYAWFDAFGTARVQS